MAMTGYELEKVRKGLGLGLEAFKNLLGLEVAVSTIWSWERRRGLEIPTQASNQIADFLNQVHSTDVTTPLELVNHTKQEDWDKVTEYLDNHTTVDDSRVVAYECGISKEEVDKVVQEVYGYKSVGELSRNREDFGLKASKEIGYYLRMVAKQFPQNQDKVTEINNGEVDLWHYIEKKLDLDNDFDGSVEFLKNIKQERIERRIAKDQNYSMMGLWKILQKYPQLLEELKEAEKSARETKNLRGKRTYTPREV